MQIKELLDASLHHSCDGIRSDQVCVRIAAIGDMPSRFGDFQVVAFYINRDEKEPAAFIHGDVCDAKNVPLRVHSQCLTNDAIGSFRN